MKYNNPQQMVLTGKQTPQTVIFKSESHKLHQAFPVKKDAVIIQGQPVKLNTDGTIEAYFGEGVYLGIATTNSINPAYPEYNGSYEVTVMVEAFALVYGVSEAGFEAGPVAPSKLDDDSQYVTYKGDSAEAHPKFIALSKAEEAGELVQILVR